MNLRIKRLLEGALMNQISKELGKEFNSIMRVGFDGMIGFSL